MIPRREITLQLLSATYLNSLTLIKKETYIYVSIEIKLSLIIDVTATQATRKARFIYLLRNI